MAELLKLICDFADYISLSNNLEVSISDISPWLLSE